MFQDLYCIINNESILNHKNIQKNENLQNHEFLLKDRICIHIELNIIFCLFIDIFILYSFKLIKLIL